MEKKVRTFPVNYHLDWTCGVSIAEIREDLNELEKLGATDVEIDIDYYHECTSISIKAVSNRLETNEEYEKRVMKENILNNANRDMELTELARLKKKYENK